MNRPPWPHRMLALASLWGSFSTCKRRQVGAVIFDPETKAVISIGYNDTPIGQRDCGDDGCPPCGGSIGTSLMISCRCVHAEENAILLAARRGTTTQGCSLATTHTACTSCIKSMIQAGIRTVYEAGRDPYDPEIIYDEEIEGSRRARTAVDTLGGR